MDFLEMFKLMTCICLTLKWLIENLRHSLFHFELLVEWLRLLIIIYKLLFLMFYV